MPLRLLLADDSAVMRHALSDALASDSRYHVIGSAPNGKAALALAETERPDLLILDLEMPELDGAGVLQALKARPGRPRVLVLTAHGALASSEAIQALLAGADDVILKPRFGPESYAERQASLKRLLDDKLAPYLGRAHAPPPPPAAPQAPLRSGFRPRAVLIGISTGGPEALQELLPALPAGFPLPIAVVQHIPPGFTQALALQLDRRCALRVVEGEHLAPFRPGTIHLAPGGRHMAIAGKPDEPYLVLNDDPPENSCRPAVDVLFRSGARCFGGDLACAVLTGMGNDGTAGARVARTYGARVLVQDAATSVVWGMPGAVSAAGLADETLPLGAIAGRLRALAAEAAR